jgi:hypothetical protein
MAGSGGRGAEGLTDVVYITGYPRSGTTILGSALGEADGVFHAGEIRFLWERTLVHGVRRCGCGEPVTGCQLWKRVLADVAAEVSGSRSGDLVKLGATVHGWQRQGVWPGNERALIDGTLTGPAAEGAERYAAVLSSLYGRISDATGASVIVDSSKWVGDAALLRTVPDVSPFIVHITRDPRAVALSRQRKLMTRHGMMNSLRRRWSVASDSLEWSRVTLMSEALLRSGRAGVSIRYEDLMSNPAGMTRELRDAGLPIGDVPFIGRDAIVLGTNHTLGGNRSRFVRGQARLQVDARWGSELRATDRLIVSALTIRTRRRYGYPSSPPPPAAQGS